MDKTTADTPGDDVVGRMRRERVARAIYETRYGDWENLHSRKPYLDMAQAAIDAYRATTSAATGANLTSATQGPTLTNATPSQTTLEHAVQEAIDILLSERPTHEAVVVLRKTLGQDVWGTPRKRVTFPTSEVGFTLAQEPEPVTKMPKVDPGPWR